jgi:hypothetical protein
VIVWPLARQTSLRASSGAGTPAPVPTWSTSTNRMCRYRPASATAKPKHRSASRTVDRGGVYTIAPGDDLLEISRRFGTTVKVIQEQNNLTGTEIIAGQTLLIPGGE